MKLALAFLLTTVRSLWDPLVIGGSVLTTGLLFLMDAGIPLWIRNVWLLLALLCLMTVEIVTRWRHDIKNSLDFSVRDVILSKMMLLSLVVVAALLDWVLYELSPIGFASTELVSHNWITKSVLVWLIAASALDTVHNVERSEGSAAMIPVLRHVVRLIRLHDRNQWPGQTAPQERWYDSLDELTEEEILALVERRRRRQDAEGRQA